MYALYSVYTGTIVVMKIRYYSWLPLLLYRQPKGEEINVWAKMSTAEAAREASVSFIGLKISTLYDNIHLSLY